VDGAALIKVGNISNDSRSEKLSLVLDCMAQLRRRSRHLQIEGIEGFNLHRLVQPIHDRGKNIPVSACGPAIFYGRNPEMHDCARQIACYIAVVPAYLRPFAGVSLRRRPCPTINPNPDSNTPLRI
jgi:hypothetical protein